MSENENPYFVDVADVDKYVDFRILESLSKGKVIELKSVEPIHSESGEYLNDNLYTLTGDWTIVVNGENRAYNYRRELIYGFFNMQ